MVYWISTTGRLWSNFKTRLHNSLLLWERPLPVAMMVALVFVAMTATAGAPWRVTDRAYFNYLADAFLHGQTHLRVIPPTQNDLTLYNGKYYLYWGPLPAVIAMPLVAIFGLQVSDVLQAIVFGVLDAVLFSVLLRVLDRRKIIETTQVQRAFLVIFFALGSSFTTLPAIGKVWYLVTVEMLFFALLAYIAAFSLENEKAFFGTGCAIAGVLLTRISAVFVAIF